MFSKEIAIKSDIETDGIYFSIPSKDFFMHNDCVATALSTFVENDTNVIFDFAISEYCINSLNVYFDTRNIELSATSTCDKFEPTGNEVVISFFRRIGFSSCIYYDR